MFAFGWVTRDKTIYLRNHQNCFSTLSTRGFYIPPTNSCIHNYLRWWNTVKWKVTPHFLFQQYSCENIANTACIISWQQQPPCHFIKWTNVTLELSSFFPSEDSKASTPERNIWLFSCMIFHFLHFIILSVCCLIWKGGVQRVYLCLQQWLWIIQYMWLQTFIKGVLKS